jgi:hypothetical protein
VEKENLRFSGHDTFHCKEQWLLKGIQLIENKTISNPFSEDVAIPILGVGKNMVRSINYWLKSFGLIDTNNYLTDFAKLIFANEFGFDKYIEKVGTLWLLQYTLCKNEYASIFNLIFSDFFSDKASFEFSESQVINHINRKLLTQNQRGISNTTISSDFKVFIKTYVSPTKHNNKTFEDDLSAPLIQLGLIINTKRVNSKGETVFKLNKTDQNTIPTEIFIYCLIQEFGDNCSINIDSLRRTIGSYLCITNDGLEKLIEQSCNLYNEIVYKDDAGIKQLQIKKTNEHFLTSLLSNYYERD